MGEMDQRPPSQKLPAGLAGVLNRPEDNRDSAYYSSTDSKHNSAASCHAVAMLGPRDSGPTPPSHHSTNTPSPTPINTSSLMPQPMVSPSTSNMSVASMVSPTSPASIDRRKHDRPQSFEAVSNGHAHWSGDHGDQSISRRESVDSRIINQGLGEMKLGNSPYTSHHPSTTSIQGNLQQQRNPRPAQLDSLAVHRISNGYQPSQERNPDPHPKITRTAPAITGPATGHIARAAEPTKGQAWAFPEEEIQRMPSAATQSLVDSRRSSVADSLASSQFTTESRLPPGQRHLDDGMSVHDRYSTTSTDFPALHHHSLQHKQIGDLQSDAAGLQAGSQPYSRTPELRRSHKLAERKRRTEMKELFEELRDLMPQERGSKASKWEILTKAIAEHRRQQDTLRSLHSSNNALHHEVDAMRRELMGLRNENSQLRNELAASSNTHHGISAANGQVGADQYSRGPAPRPELPPLRSLANGMAGAPDTMTGVQYDQPRPNGFRH